MVIDFRRLTFSLLLPVLFYPPFACLNMHSARVVRTTADAALKKTRKHLIYEINFVPLELSIDKTR